MQYSQGTIGRVFVLRLGDGDKLPGSIEDFAAAHGVSQAFCALVGGADDGSRVVAGPRDGAVMPPEPMTQAIHGVHEAAAVGTIFPDAKGQPKLHMHAALGRGKDTVTGCVRAGVDIWKIGEVVILEIAGTDMARRIDPQTGFELLCRA
ncbi:MAG: DNA-binding protein [Desulfovibrionaceae bacterium]|nr:DNA-binding protein [Desulfovibrionaceae bacterium]MBF0513137.1 DNA-binding protein [Desulfovibrionaceae bacterium]